MVKIKTIESVMWNPRRLTKQLEERLKKEFGEDATPEFINLVRVAYATHEHALLHLASECQYKITKEKFLEWIGRAWDVGEHQLRVYTMEEEGGVSNELGVALKFGDFLSLLGKRNGYLSSSTVSRSDEIKHQKLAKKIKAELIKLKEISSENIIFDSTDLWQRKDKGVERNEEKFKELEEVWDDEDFPKKLLDRGFTNYLGCDAASDLDLTIYVGRIKDRTYPRTNGILIRSLSSEIPTLYLITNHNPASVGSYREEQLVFGLKHDVVGPLIEYVDKNVEWEYNPESMAYCDGSVLNEKNLEIAENTLEYILACFNISKPQN